MLVIHIQYVHSDAISVIVLYNRELHCDLDLAGPGLDLAGPEVDLAGPRLDLGGPGLDLAGPGLPRAVFLHTVVIHIQYVDRDKISAIIMCNRELHCHLDLAGPEVDLRGPGLDLESPGLDLGGPRLDLAGPELLRAVFLHCCRDTYTVCR
jgi:hypothetical protein